MVTPVARGGGGRPPQHLTRPRRPGHGVPASLPAGGAAVAGQEGCVLRRIAPAAPVGNPAPVGSPGRASGTARRVRPVTPRPVPGPVGDRVVDGDLDGIGGGEPR